MKKLIVTFMLAMLAGVAGLKAQSLENGINDLYAQRYKSAKSTFEKLLSANPNNIDATYWLGQTYIQSGDPAGAKGVYDKALMASANAPLVIVGRGQVDLIENKVSEARQRFEAAITMTRGKKGDDPVILNAVGRAITNTYNDKDKKGDINYAIQQLEAAAARDPKNAEIFLNLGNAYRKARPGEGGGKAFENYKLANAANASFAVPSYRLAQLFYSQRNYSLYEEYLNEAIQKDPRFAPAYYDLYYLKLGKLDMNAAEGYAKKYMENSDPDPQNDYLRVQTLWAKKDFDGAIAGAKNIIAQAGAATKPRVYKLIADSYVQKKDTAAAKPFIDDYFAKVKSTGSVDDDDPVTSKDYGLKADIYSAIPGQEDVVIASYLEGIKADTVIDNKVALLKKGIAFFNGRKQYDKESELQELLLQTKPNLNINDYFGAGLANYRAKDYITSYNIFKTVSEKYPDQAFGWEWMYNNAILIDTVKKDSIALQAAQKLNEFSSKDSVKYAKQLGNSYYFLATYALDKGEKAKAIDYLKKMKAAEPDEAKKQSIQQNIDQLSSAQTTRPATRPAPPKNNK